VWQNHGLQVEGVPADFKLLATSYLCKNQMMVKRSGGQMIYAVQFHLEKSFEDWSKIRLAGSILTNRATGAFVREFLKARFATQTEMSKVTRLVG
jgi:GMP synthase-like glutamine amidotransferase